MPDKKDPQTQPRKIMKKLRDKPPVEELEQDQRIIAERVGWGPFAAVGIGILAYLLPQIVIAFIIAIYTRVEGLEFDEFFISGDSQQLFLLSASTSVIGLLVLWVYVRNRGGLKALGVRRTTIRDALKSVPAYFIYFAGILVVFGVLSQVAPMVDLEQEQEIGFNAAGGGIEMLYAFITLVILAPVFEELLFRGFTFQGIAARFGFWPGAIAASALFGLAHGQLNVGIDTFVLGIVACWLVYSTRSIVPAILLHGIKNGIAFLFLFTDLPSRLMLG